jgi:hypothetical protein
MRKPETQPKNKPAKNYIHLAGDNTYDIRDPNGKTISNHKTLNEAKLARGDADAVKPT